MPFAAALRDNFPVIESSWPDASRAIEEVAPAAVLLAASGDAGETVDMLAKQVASRQPYVPLIVIGPKQALPVNAIPFSPIDGSFDRLSGRLSAALRVRTLHSTVLRRTAGDSTMQKRMSGGDPIEDATVLLIGRGGAYPALSVALGERMGVVGAFSIEAAAKHLNSRDLNGIILGEGFSGRVVDGFLTVLAEDARFRHLPIVTAIEGLKPSHDLPNLELSFGDPEHIASHALPLIRQHAFEARLSRALKSIEAGGLLDPRTGLLTLEAFDRDFATAIRETSMRGGGLSVARVVFGQGNERAKLDGGRILSRLMRKMDFGALQDDGSIVVVFTETDLRNARMIARRLSGVMKYTRQTERESHMAPAFIVTALLPSDSANSILTRLTGEPRRAAS
jgi:hypothetical protein